jgi:hypothetical protein
VKAIRPSSLSVYQSGFMPACTGPERPNKTKGDAMRIRTQAALAALTMLLGVAVFAGSGGRQNNETRLRTRLAGAAIEGKTPEGNADFRSDQRGRSRLNVQVENVNLPAGTVLTVAVQDGTTVINAGTITLPAFGFGELELNSEDGASVPAVHKGEMVTVSNGGVRILAGVF